MPLTKQQAEKVADSLLAGADEARERDKAATIRPVPFLYRSAPSRRLDGRQGWLAYQEVIRQPFTNYLDGSKNYRIQLPANVPVRTFWSIIPYDTQTRSVLQTDQRDTALSSESGTVKLNEDGPTDIYFGPTAPAGKESNWIQTSPGKGWFTLLRLYGALEPWFDKSWRPGEIEVVN